MNFNLRLFVKQVGYSLTSLSILLRVSHPGELPYCSFSSRFSPYPDLVRKYAFFDKQMPLLQRRKMMRFYRSCLRRHLFARRSVKNSTPKPRLSVRRLIRFSSFSRMPKSSIWCSIHWILSLRKMGLSKKQILETCALVFKHFDFDTR